MMSIFHSIPLFNRILIVVFIFSVSFAQKPKLVVQAGHFSYVNAVAFSPDGKFVASGSGDNTIKVWNVATGEELYTLAGHAGPVSSIAFSPSGENLASGSWDKTIKIWNVGTGRELRTLRGHTYRVFAVAFSPDGTKLASGSGDKTIKMWDVNAGKELYILRGHTDVVWSVAFSPDGNTLASGDDNAAIRLWDVSTAKGLSTIRGNGRVTSVAFSLDGKILASAGGDHSIKLWDVGTRQELRTLSGHDLPVGSVSFSPDGKILASAGDFTVRLWDISTGGELQTLWGHTKFVECVAFNPSGRIIASGSEDRSIKLWDAGSGKEIRTLGGHTCSVQSVAISPDGKTLASGNSDKSVRLWDVGTGKGSRALEGSFEYVTCVAFGPLGEHIASGSADKSVRLWQVGTGREFRTLWGHSDCVYGVAFSPDGKTIASASFDKTIRLWDIGTGEATGTFVGHTSCVNSVAFSPDGKTLASGSWDKTVRLWDAGSARCLRTLRGCTDGVRAVAFSPDGRTLVSGSDDLAIRLWDVGTGRELRSFRGHTHFIESVIFSPDGMTLASGSEDNTIKLWEIATGKEIRTLKGHASIVTSIAFSPDGKILASGSSDNTIKLWEIVTGKQLGSLIALGKDDWVVITPQGVFDTSPGGMKLMHWVVGLEAIDLEQLKERYYEPGLLSKLLGFNKEPLRAAPSFDQARLFPQIEHHLDGKRLALKLNNRGGGLGKVQVLVNGKEVVADARPQGFNSNDPEATISVDLSEASVMPGRENEVRVVAWNSEGYLSSRGATVKWKPPGSEQIKPPEVYAIIGGVSSYSSPALQLRFAAKDAEDVAKAIQLGARRLFGAEKVHLSLLSTSGSPNTAPPTKENFRKAFEDARKATPYDILIVYLAGHGVSLQRGSDMYCYLTQEARSTDVAVLSDPVVRSQTTITSEELLDWAKRIPALKQVMILDACGAGSAAAKLVEKRDVSSDQVRAIDRLKDRTGFHILMGCAADAVSYEASRYGQGVLTYALLQGIRGAALRDDQFVDVSKLFQYAADEVPRLAGDIGGVQKPEIAAPIGTSFDIGQLTKEDKEKVPLEAAKPVILRPQFINADVAYDDLELTAAVKKQLNEESYKSARSGGSQSEIVFVDADELPGAIRPSGTYTTSKQEITVRLVLLRNGQRVRSLQVSGSKIDLKALVSELSRAITSESVKF